MPIKVRFDKNGFHSSVYGRLGRGKNEGRVYTLPDEYGIVETVKVPVMDNSSKPPKMVGEKEITRYKNIPSSAEIIDDGYVAELLEDLENTGGDEAAEIEDEIEQIKHAVRPKVATPEALDKLKRTAGTGRDAPPQDAIERTTGKRRAKKAVAAE